MTIELTKTDLEQFIAEQVRAGRFASATEVVEAGIARLMLDPEPEESDPEVDAAIERADEEYARGEDRPFEEVAAELRRKYLTK
jgi:Arc/MetJ-type ribon-helix-helix transcriptional regulator